MSGEDILMQTDSTIWQTLLITMIMQEFYLGEVIGKIRKNISRQPMQWPLLQWEFQLFIMELSNITLEVMIQIIDKFYGETWIETQKCIVSLQRLIVQGRELKSGINLRLKDTQIMSFMPTLVVSSWYA